MFNIYIIYEHIYDNDDTTNDTTTTTNNNNNDNNNDDNVTPMCVCMYVCM